MGSLKNKAWKISKTQGRSDSWNRAIITTQSHLYWPPDGVTAVCELLMLGYWPSSVISSIVLVSG